MKIILSPSRRDAPLELIRSGDRLTLNGEAFDFSPLREGATLPAEAIDSDWFVGPVERIGGVLHVMLTLPHGARAPQETLFPEPITLDGDGPVELPPYTTETRDAD